MPIQQLNRKNNFLYLLLSLLAMLFAGAISDEFPEGAGNDLFSLVLIFSLIVGIKSLHLNVGYKRIVYTLAAALGVITLLWRFSPSSWSALLILLMMLFAFISAFKLTVRQILFEGRVDANKIIGSLSLYLLIGLIWTVLYLILLIFDPTAFKGIEFHDWRTIFSQMAYYSFVTLTTLGYGDISPRNHIAEFVVYLEAVVGVFYMAIFVSSLISLTDTKREKTPIEEETSHE